MPRKKADPQSFGRVRDPVRIAEGPTLDSGAGKGDVERNRDADSFSALSILAASLRQEARERRIVADVKPFIGTQRVTNPVRQSRASSRKRVLRGGG